jgi:hypothetical protein
MMISVQAPGMPALPTVRLGEIWQLDERARDAKPGGDPTVVAAVVFARKVAQGKRGTMALVCAAPTRRPADAADATMRIAPHGDWIVFVSFGPVDQVSPGPKVRVHAWTERNDLVYGSTRRQQSAVIGDDPVPDPTEFMADSLRILGRGRANPIDEPLPHPLQPEQALGSLAGVPHASHDFMIEETSRVADADLGLSPDGVSGTHGAVVVVGAHRLADAEVSAYSSGGPARDVSAHAESIAWFGPAHQAEALMAASQRRVAPDADAPGDLSPAVPGIRVAAIRPGGTARISGTSAAAAAVTRAIANYLTLERALPPPVRGDPESIERFKRLRRKLRNLLFAPANVARPPSPTTNAARATPTPRKDDLFRRGRSRAR